MTEEIMIGGINVSECCFYNKGKCDNPNGMACNCINNAVCYFKELKHLEQKYNEVLKLAKENADSNEYCIQELKKENEIITMENQEASEIIVELEKENEKLKAVKDKYYQMTLDDEIQFNELMQENGELKEKVKRLDKMTGIFSARLCGKYRHALKEIKEIINEQCKQCYAINGFAKPGDCGICEYKILLDTINKVLESEG